MRGKARLVENRVSKLRGDSQRSKPAPKRAAAKMKASKPNRVPLQLYSRLGFFLSLLNNTKSAKSSIAPNGHT